MRRNSKIKAWIATAGGACLIAAAVTFVPHARAQQDFSKVEIRVIPIRENMYMFAGAGGNTTVQIGKDGVLLVDTQFAPMAPKILAELKKLTDKPIRMIINTHVHGDHVGGNEALANAGQRISGGNENEDFGEGSGRASILAHQNVLNLMSATPTGKPGDRAMKSGFWPTDTFIEERKKVFFNGEGLEVLHIPSAHSSSDSIVFFRRSDVISAGDIFAINRYPVYDIEGGGSIQGMLAGLNRILSMAIPAEKEEGGTYIVPGHGRLCDLADLAEYRDMTTIIRDRIQDMINKGMTLEQVKAARPTLDYDPLYGAQTGLGSTDNFVTQVYTSLSRKK
ncbi:MAG: MBL fold metallo-hydrolase [Bryobacteraceae bacterium]